MRRAGRRLFMLCWALSLLLCAIAAIMLVRSFFVRDEIVWAQPGGSLVLINTREERVAVTVVGPGWPERRDVHWTRFWAGEQRPIERALWPMKAVRIDGWPLGVLVYRGWGWFTRGHGGDGPTYPITVVGLRWDVLVLLFALLPAARAVVALRRRIRRRRRLVRGLCPECGYDLRASSERCPECGRTSTTAGPIPSVNA